MDKENGSIIRTCKRTDKIVAIQNEKNLDRPVLTRVKFADWKAGLLQPPADDEELDFEKLESIFLDNTEDEPDQDMVLIATFPRSGNTLLRAYTDKCMGLPTGSDRIVAWGMNKTLMTKGLAGEGIINKRC